MKKLSLAVVMCAAVISVSGSIACAASVFDNNHYGTGYIFDQKAYSQIPIMVQQTTRAYSALPPSYSLKQYAPFPGNQGGQSSCVGWATSYAAMTILESITLSRTDRELITQEAFSPSFVYNQIKYSEYDCSDGSRGIEAMDILSETGTVRLKDYGYSCGNDVASDLVTKASGHKIYEYARLDTNNRINAIKKSIADNRPVIISTQVGESFQAMIGKDLWIPPTQPEQGGGHAMCVVGYDDNKYGGALEIQNSWGTTWGNQGYIWVKYEDFPKLYREGAEFYTMYSQPAAENKVALQGSMSLTQESGDEMKAVLSSTASRDFNIVNAESSTYRLGKSYPSGTRFRIYFTSGNAGYVYLISYGTTTKKVVPIYPFEKYSAYFDSKNAEVAIPNEDFYIQMDDNVGKDYLCILYSKKELNIRDISERIQEKTGTFAGRLKEVMQDRIVDSKNVTFEKGKISFKASSDDNRYVVPVIVEFNHTK